MKDNAATAAAKGARRNKKSKAAMAGVAVAAVATAAVAAASAATAGGQHGAGVDHDQKLGVKEREKAKPPPLRAMSAPVEIKRISELHASSESSSCSSSASFSNTPNSSTCYAPLSPLSFLENSFSEISRERLADLLSQANNDVEDAVNLVLEELSESESYGSSAASETSTDDFGDIWSQSSDGGWDSERSTSADVFIRPAIVSTDPAIQTLSEIAPGYTLSQLQDVLAKAGGNVEAAGELILTSPPPPPDTPSPPHRVKKITERPSQMFSFAKENKRDQQVELLQSMFPDHPRKSIESALAVSRGNMERAAEHLMSLEVLADAREEEGKSRDHDLAVLTEMFPNVSVSVLTRELGRAGTGLEGVVERLAVNERASFGAVASSGVKAQRRESMTAMYTSSTTGSNPYTRFGLYMEPDEIPNGGGIAHHGARVRRDFGTPKDLRSKAEALKQERNDAFKRAAAAYRKGDLTGQGSAVYYSQEGRDLALKMAEWNDQAAKAVIERNRQRQNNDPYILDLHELTVREALDYVSEAVNEWFSHEGASTSPRKPLKIIAGAGHHTRNGVRKLYPAVFGYLRQKGWRLKEGGNGWFFVLG
ncbi:hypothetical protein HDV00_004252 [Rhizophlyctis rosea]|nr:hypothetical protein HDV00_004252 [Rhizophlyctis rosea]